jgi:hypothetical protein
LEVLDKLNSLDQKLGAPKPAEKPPATAEPPKLEKFSGTIKSVDAKAKSIVVADGNVEKTFVVDEKAKITKDTSGLTIADLKAEMPAVVEYKKEGDKMIASAIKLSAPEGSTKGK